MKFPAATRKDHQTFCVTEGWEKRKSARGKTGDHHRYELVLSDGRILYTRVSFPVNDRDSYGPQLWSHILRDQLDVTSEEFWACVNEGVKPSRGVVEVEPHEAIPAGVVATLLGFGVPEHDIHGMTKQQAIKRMTDLYSGTSD